jgi:hypothetical protein
MKLQFNQISLASKLPHTRRVHLDTKTKEQAEGY